MLAGLALGATLPAHAVSLIAPGDAVYGISLNSDSNPNAGQTADKATDGDPNSKYLNFGRYNSGIIYTGSSPFTVQSLGFTTGGDAAERDPTSYLLLGSNDASINTSSASNAVSNGWTLIGTGALSLSDTRGSVSSLNLTNTASYSSYWLVFPTLKDTPGTANSLQISEANLYSGAGATGTKFTATTVAGTSWTGNFPNSSAFAEQPNKVVDGNPATKYLNFGKEGTGFVVYPSVGNTVPSGFTFTTAGDVQARDPLNYTIYGQNSAGVWSTILAGTFTSAQLPAARSTTGVTIPYTTDGTIYKAYGFVANSLFDTVNANSMQIGDFQVDGYVIPEASSALLGMVGVFGMAGFRRRRN